MDSFFALWLGIAFDAAVAFWVAWCVVIEFRKLRSESHAENWDISQRIYELEHRRYPVELDDLVEAYGLVKSRLDDLEENRKAMPGF